MRREIPDYGGQLLSSVALVPGTLLWREDFARRVGASGARPRAERRSALRVGCGYAAL